MLSILRYSGAAIYRNIENLILIAFVTQFFLNFLRKKQKRVSCLLLAIDDRLHNKGLLISKKFLWLGLYISNQSVTARSVVQRISSIFNAWFYCTLHYMLYYYHIFVKNVCYHATFEEYGTG